MHSIPLSLICNSSLGSFWSCLSAETHEHLVYATHPAGGGGDWASKAAEVVRRVMSNKDCGWPFAKPVKASQAPGYFKVCIAA
jgi:hypothetical protein